MKLKKAIHPEMVAGLRGDPEAIKRYQLIFKELRFEKDGSMRLKGDGVISQVPFFRRALGIEGEQYTDWSLLRFHAMIQDWRAGTRKSYYIGPDFAETLKEVDLKIPMRILPESFFGYIAFPPDTIYDEEEAIDGCYVRIGACSELSLHIKGTNSTDRFLWICAMSQDLVGKHSDMLCALPNEDCRLEDILFSLKRGEWADYVHTVINGMKTPLDDDTQRKREAVFRVALNTVIYTRSEGAELISCASERNLTKSKRLEFKTAGRLTDCTVPLILIHPSYHKPREIHVEGTWVRSHPRWQPCGPLLSQVKLIWVKEHERRYKKLSPSEAKAFQ